MLPWTTLLIWSTICRFLIFFSLSHGLLLHSCVPSCLTFSVFYISSVCVYFTESVFISHRIGFFQNLLWSRFYRRVRSYGVAGRQSSSVAANWLSAVMISVDPTTTSSDVWDLAVAVRTCEPESTPYVHTFHFRFTPSLVVCQLVRIAAIHILVRRQREDTHIFSIQYISVIDIPFRECRN